MTKLEKRVVREARQRHMGDVMIVALDPAGFFEVRLKGTRVEPYRVTFDQVVSREAEARAKEARAAKALAKRLRRR